ncbi:MAG: hypothetical protein IJ375_07060 [Oscillospiraceae bacterium]|nr:hypothetical protein [Oscillospiraceae bacterium]
MKKILLLVLTAALLLSACAPAAVQNEFVLAVAEYPAMSPYPDEMSFVDEKTGVFDDEGFSVVFDAWLTDRKSQYDQPEGYADTLTDYFLLSIPEFLEGEGNTVCSPLNIYMALAMLAEVTGGGSRQQILDLLGADSIEALRTQAGYVWNAHYCADGGTASVLANSLWLDEGLRYSADTVSTLAKDYFASVYQGDLGSGEMNKALQEWLDEQTGGLLEEQTQNVAMDPQTVLALASAIYYRVKWASEFSESRSTEGIFHAPGGDTEVTYMNTTLSYGPYYWGEGFAAAYLGLEDGGRMWLVLPDEGVTPGALLESGTALDMILGGSYEDQTAVQVNLSLPKFDITADTQLNEKLSALGVTEVFGGDADFTPILPQDEAWLDSAQHAARVAIDEEGITAAAYTVMMACGASMPPEDEVDLILDRPFLFVITSRDNLPLFAGVVNEP